MAPSAVADVEGYLFERRQEVHVHLVWSTWDQAP